MFPNGTHRGPDREARPVTEDGPVLLSDFRQADCINCGRTVERHSVDADGFCPACRVAALHAAQLAADCALSMVTQAVTAALEFASPNDIQAHVVRAIEEHGHPARTRVEMSSRLERAEGDLDNFLVRRAGAA